MKPTNKAGAEKFGSRLRRLRCEANRTIKDVACFARLKPNYIEKIERGYKGAPSALAIRDLARAVRADADELFALSDKLPVDLERVMKERPLLLQVVRIAAEWDRAQLRDFLALHGVPAKKIDACDVERQCPKNDDRACRREPISREMREHIFHVDNFECVYCSKTVFLEVDHIYPHSQGGTDEFENLVTSCADCNSKKRNREVPFVMVFGRFREEVENLCI